MLIITAGVDHVVHMYHVPGTDMQESTTDTLKTGTLHSWQNWKNSLVYCTHNIVIRHISIPLPPKKP